jgi:S-DNA-T family DNA segregation ATPase FtsK/SpoIIIE
MYVVDYGSEALRIFANLPHLGGMVFGGDIEGYINLNKLINNEIRRRKQLFVNYGGDYKNYNKSSGEKLPLIVVYINNLDSVVETMPNILENAPEIFRDTERYGVVYVITASGYRVISSKGAENFPQRYALKLKDTFEYNDTIGGKAKQTPSEALGRGLFNNGEVHEYQTASIVEDDSKLSDYILEYIERIKSKNNGVVKKIPTLPDKVELEHIKADLKDIRSVPVGIYKGDLTTTTLDLIDNLGTIITANKIGYTKNFVKSFIKVLKTIGTGVILIDGTKELEDMKTETANYFNDDLGNMIDKISEVIDKHIEEKTSLNAAVIFYGMDKIISKTDDVSKIEELLKKLKNYEQVPAIVVDDSTKIKNSQFDNWYRTLFENTAGIWIGTGVTEQSVLKVTGFVKEFTAEFPNNIGFYVAEGIVKQFKTIELEQGDEENEQ